MLIPVIPLPEKSKKECNLNYITKSIKIGDVLLWTPWCGEGLNYSQILISYY